MSELKLKELKDILDDNELDLSARGLISVPKDVVQLPRATHIDLGSNKISVLLPEICTMNRIVRLELGSNQLVVLPDNFGNLVNLQHLDLYNNRIEELPVSFSNLKNLRWLDLKRNPLESNLLKAAGNCGSERECKQAAGSVVAYMNTVKQSIEAQVAKQDKVHQKIKAVKAEVKRDNAKKKDDKAAEAAAKKLQTGHHSHSKPAAAAAKEQPKEKTTKKKCEAAPSCIGRMLRFLIRWTVTLSIIFGAACTVNILMNCVNGGTTIPGSKPLCADLTRLSQFQRPSDKFVVNLKNTYGTVANNYKSVAQYHWRNVASATKSYYAQAVKSDFGKKVDKFLFAVHAFVVEKSLLVQKFVVQQWTALNAWYARDGHKYVGSAVENVKVAAGIVYEVAKDGVAIAANALSVVYHRVENFFIVWQEKGFSKAFETVV